MTKIPQHVFKGRDEYCEECGCPQNHKAHNQEPARSVETIATSLDQIPSIAEQLRNAKPGDIIWVPSQPPIVAVIDWELSSCGGEVKVEISSSDSLGAREKLSQEHGWVLESATEPCNWVAVPPCGSYLLFPIVVAQVTTINTVGQVCSYPVKGGEQTLEPGRYLVEITTEGEAICRLIHPARILAVLVSYGSG